MIRVLRPYRPTETSPKVPPIRADDPRYNRRQAAAYLGVRPQTLAAWASSKIYKLPYFMVGNKSIYLKSNLDSFLRSREKGSVLV